MSNAMKVTEKREPHKRLVGNLIFSTCKALILFSLNDKGEQCRCAVEDGVEPGDRGKVRLKMVASL